MSAFNGAHSVRGGYNQSGGAYFVCVTRLTSAAGEGVAPVVPATLATLVNGAGGALDSTHLYKIDKAASKSGGAFEAATLLPVSAVDVLGGGLWSGAEAAAEFNAGQLIRDMGKTIVDINGRTFRKFAVVGPNRVNGVEGGLQTAPGAGYGTFYLDVGRDGKTGTAIPAPIARYF